MSRGRKGPRGCRESAKSIERHLGRLQRAVLEHTRSRGDVGATCDEVELELHLLHQTASARFWELHDLGLISRTGRRRTRNRRQAAVYVANW